jgi:hypothetical protein
MTSELKMQIINRRAQIEAEADKQRLKKQKEFWKKRQNALRRTTYCNEWEEAHVEGILNEDDFGAKVPEDINYSDECIGFNHEQERAIETSEMGLFGQRKGPLTERFVSRVFNLLFYEERREIGYIVPSKDDRRGYTTRTVDNISRILQILECMGFDIPEFLKKTPRSLRNEIETSFWLDRFTGDFSTFLEKQYPKLYDFWSKKEREVKIETRKRRIY